MALEDLHEKIDGLTQKIGEIEGLLKIFSSDSDQPAKQETFRLKMEALEDRLESFLQQRPLPETLFPPAAFKSQLERLEGIVERRQAEQAKSLSTASFELKTKIASLTSRLEFLENHVQDQKKGLAREAEILLKLERLEAGFKKQNLEEHAQRVENLKQHFEDVLQGLRNELHGIETTITETRSDSEKLAQARLEELKTQIDELRKTRSLEQDSDRLERNLQIENLQEQIQVLQNASPWLADVQNCRKEMAVLEQLQASLYHQVETFRQTHGQGLASETQLQALKQQLESFQQQIESLCSSKEAAERLVLAKIDDHEKLLTAHIQQLVRTIEQRQNEWFRVFQTEMAHKIAETRRQISNELHQDALWQGIQKKMQLYFAETKERSRHFLSHLIETETKAMKEKAKRFLILAVYIFLLSGAIGFHFLAVRHERQMTELIGTKLSEPRLKNTLKQAAYFYTPQVLRTELEKISDRGIRKIDRDEKSFSEFLEKLQENYRSEFHLISDQARFLHQKQELARLEEEAVMDGNRAAYEKIKMLAGQEPESGKMLYVESLQRIGKLYQDLNRIRDFSLADVHPSQEKLQRLLLSDADWRVRAKAAAMLSFKADSQNFAILLEAAQKDSHLEVVHQALLSFCQMTGYSNPDLLNAQAAASWWQSKNSPSQNTLK